MAFCTQCGLIMANEDADKHVCKTADLPTKGVAKKPTTTNVSPTVE